MPNSTATPGAPRPDATGHFGLFGGRYVPETLMTCLIELDRAYREVKGDPEFQRELDYWLGDYAGRPTKLYKAERLAAALNPNISIYLKREDLLHTGAHKINNALGQALLARRIGKRRIIAETGAGQHGVATATACALLGLECEVFMGAEDMERQRLNVARMRLLGTTVTKVTSGSQTLKDATNEAMRDWMASVDTTHYIIGSVVGPHPFPMLVRDFQAVIGNEARAQILEREGRLPDLLVACVGGGSNSIGLFHPFFDDAGVRFHGVEAGGFGLASGQHSMSLGAGELGVFHGSRSYVLQNGDGQILTAHSISAGLDYPGVGPEHSFFKDTGRADYFAITDDEALGGVKLLAQTEGIIPALESAHAIAHLGKISTSLKDGAMVLVCLSGRGDKDMETIVRELKL